MNASWQTDAQKHYQQIAALAYSSWEKEGRQPGHHLDNWLQAEQRFQGGQQKQPRDTTAAIQIEAVKRGNATSVRPGNRNSSK